MASQETQTADSKARVTLPLVFAKATVVVEVVSASEVRIRKIGDPMAIDAGLPENDTAVLSARDRDRFIELIASPPSPNAALRKAMGRRTKE